MEYRTEIRVRPKAKGYMVGKRIRTENANIDDLVAIQVNGYELDLINQHRNAIRELQEYLDYMGVEDDTTINI